jgi:drug/metabolite transporter (DMT)-like permease
MYWKKCSTEVHAVITLQGVIVTAISYYMQMWTIAKRGPVFLAMSMPLTMIFTIIISSLILGDAVSLGRYNHNPS